MYYGKSLTIMSHLINIIIFFYFVITLIKINMLDMLGLLISGFGILSSLIANIVAELEK